MNRIGWLLIAIVILGAFLRFYNLGNNPPAAYGDEISFAWNAWNILKLGTDEYKNPYPIQFKAFDDYKAPIPVYLLVPVIRILGLNTFAVRLPVALLGTISIIIMFFLVKLILNDKIALISAFLLSISPWHTHLSRGYFETTISLFFFIMATYFFIKSQEKINYLFLSSICFALSVYSYFTPRIMLIGFIPWLIFWGKCWLKKQKMKVFYFLLSLFILVLPLIIVTFFGKGLSRIDKLTSNRNSQIIQDVTRDQIPFQIRTSEELFPYQDKNLTLTHKIFHNRYLYWLKEMNQSYWEHFSLNFWYLYGDSSLRYFLGNMGMFYLIELPFLILGLYFLFSKYRKVFILLIGWLLIAPIPATISGKPFAIRSLAFLPAALIFPAAGLYFSFVVKNRFKFPFKLFVIFLFMISFAYYFIRYHSEYPVYAATWWGWENKTAIDLALKESQNYNQIFISNFYSGAELALGYYTSMDPLRYSLAKDNPIILADGRSFMKFGKFYIGSLDINEKRFKSNIIPPKSLYIARPEEFPSSEVIRAPDDGRTLFYVYRTK